MFHIQVILGILHFSLPEMINIKYGKYLHLCYNSLFFIVSPVMISILREKDYFDVSVHNQAVSHL